MVGTPLRFENELNGTLQNSSNLKTRVFFSRENVVIRLPYPRNSEELRQFKNFPMSQNFIVDSLAKMCVILPSGWQRYQTEEVKIIKDKNTNSNIIWGVAQYSPKNIAVKENWPYRFSKLRSDLTLNIQKRIGNMPTKQTKKIFSITQKAWWNILVGLGDEK